MEHQLFHKRHLPHLHPSEGIFFITYRLADSMPAEISRALAEEFRHENSAMPIVFGKQTYFMTFDEFLDTYDTPKNYLSTPEIALISMEAIHFLAKKHYQLICFCIMPNHVHLLIKLKEGAPDLSDIMHSLKRFTARKSNLFLKGKGAFWTHESYDRLVRNERELRNVINYILNNPVKAGLTDKWNNWPYTYLSEDYK
jgi:putative transposase